MNFQQLRTIRELTRHDYNLTDLAAASDTSQPGISRQIRDLEQEIGVAIFARHGKRITGLTEPGKTILRIVGRLLDQADQLQRATAEYAAASSGLLTVAATHTQARYALPQVVLSFRAAFPDVRIALKQSTPEYIAKWVASGEADIGIATEGLDQVPELVALPCYRWSHQVLVPDGHPLLDRGRLTLADLADFALITYDHGYTGRRHIDLAFGAAGLRPNVVLTAMDSDVIKQYVALGLGVGLMASMAFDAGRDDGLRALEAGHLFAASTTRLAVRRGACLRAYTYEFMRHFAPHLTRQELDLALASAWPQEAGAATANATPPAPGSAPVALPYLQKTNSHSRL
jgi:LysR family cys regulon transcriptional activator